ncbi:CALM-like protein [Mya arenaria]|uniref:CALM-like protein n=1 Tax=Mya arenaria TaxID=6604 RepID=A0ABY7DYZ2_MYAAR|nr:troponin C-like [Mya arenaria]WAR01823.1 CALM-like protein [Mya arenaria]
MELAVMTNEMKEICAKVFAVIDVKGRGSIPRDQIPLALRMLNHNPIDSEVERLLVDTNTELNYDEFYQLVTGRMRLPSPEEQRQELRGALAVFDIENTGAIDKDVFVAILTQLGNMKIGEREAASWVELLDRHRDGRLRIAELEELFVCEDDVKATLNGNQTWELV